MYSNYPIRAFVKSALLLAGVFGLLTVPAQADWESEANARIEQHRKRDVVLTVENFSGAPLANTDISVTQVRRRFGFGSMISDTNLFRDYNHAKFFVENFEWATMPNVRWRHHEPTQGQVSYERSDRLYEFLAAHDIKIRGHHIFTNGGDQEWVQNITEPNELFNAMQDRITGVVSHYQGKFQHWDVNNEMLWSPNYKYEEAIPFAFDGQNTPIHAWMFKRARELDPDVELFINETAIIGSDPIYMRFRDDAIALTQQLLSQGAPVDGLGVQGHINAGYDRDIVVANFEALAAAGVPIWVTEFSVHNVDVSARADDLIDLYRIAFSMPHVDGILLWGFLGEGTATHPFANAGIVGTDWVLNEAGVRFQALMNEWRTELEDTADSNGQISFRGIHGTYRVSGPNFEPVTIEIEPGAGVQNVTVNLRPTADLTGDGAVDLEDWAAFLENWQVNYDPANDNDQ